MNTLIRDTSSMDEPFKARYGIAIHFLSSEEEFDFHGIWEGENEDISWSEAIKKARKERDA